MMTTVNNTEHQGRGTYSKANSQNGDGDECRSLSKRPERGPDIVKQSAKHVRFLLRGWVVQCAGGQRTSPSTL